MRGKVYPQFNTTLSTRITPAHAGKRVQPRPGHAVLGDHPRTCGEKVWYCCQVSRCRGSPPHMRGKADGGLGVRRNQGITPAHAGKSGSACFTGERAKDHPRTCGEKCMTVTPEILEKGSPPHMRGKVTATIGEREPTRITPAHAGKRDNNPPQTLAGKDHPRTCGEKLPVWGFPCFVLGSPPHMRGKELARVTLAWVERITPAHAGKSSALALRCWR